jgi:hypothetical protein
MANNFIQDSKTYCLSTRGSDATVLNNDKNFKSHVAFDIPDFLNPDDSIAYVQVSIPYIVIPVSFFQINETNNMLEVIENGLTYQYFFEYGNYNAQEFMTDFKAILPIRYNITIDLVNSRFKITNTTYNFTLTSNSTIDYIMGFSDTITSSGLILYMPRVYNFLAIPRILLHCPELGNGNNNQNADIILAIPNNSRLNSQIVYNAPQILTLVKTEQITRLTFKLTDEGGTPINFNGVASFWSVQLDIYRKWIPKPETFGSLVKTNNQQVVQKVIKESITQK